MANRAKPWLSPLLSTTIQSSALLFALLTLHASSHHQALFFVPRPVPFLSSPRSICLAPKRIPESHSYDTLGSSMTLSNFHVTRGPYYTPDPPRTGREHQNYLCHYPDYDNLFNLLFTLFHRYLLSLLHFLFSPKFPKQTLSFPCSLQIPFPVTLPNAKLRAQTNTKKPNQKRLKTPFMDVNRSPCTTSKRYTPNLFQNSL